MIQTEFLDQLNPEDFGLERGESMELVDHDLLADALRDKVSFYVSCDADWRARYPAEVLNAVDWRALADDFVETYRRA